MIELMHHTKEHFELQEGGEYSIEIDPRRISEADIELLACWAYGFWYKFFPPQA